MKKTNKEFIAEALKVVANCEHKPGMIIEIPEIGPFSDGRVAVFKSVRITDGKKVYQMWKFIELKFV